MLLWGYDNLISSRIKIFQSIYWLQIFWDVVKHPNTPFLRLWWALGYQLAEKWLEPQKTPKSVFFAQFDPPPRKISTFLIIIAEVSYLLTFFYVESFFPTGLFSALWLFEWTQLVFLAYAKNSFSPKMTSQWLYRCAQPTSKDAVLSPGFDDAFTDSLAQSVQELWPIITSQAITVAYAGLKKDLYGNCKGVRLRRILNKKRIEVTLVSVTLSMCVLKKVS